MDNDDTLFLDGIEILKDAHGFFPDMRLGQMIQMAVDTKKRSKNYPLHDITTKEIITSMEEFIIAHKKKRGMN